ncbi:MAG: UvrD-helicase domain-containing protein [Proteobacteria bacterium]|nr:UvrD-helicase domain-containing protein [Pseudomonadota bacterium]
MHGHQVDLNPEQERAVAHGAGPLLVLAGAGTGKTRVLVHRIARLVSTGVAPWDILAVTFSNKAAGEMRQRLRALLGLAAEKMWIGTFHGTCARLLRIHGQHIGLDANFTIFDDDDQKRIIAALLKDNQLDESATPQGVRGRIDRAKNRGVDPVEAAADAPSAELGSYAEEILATIYPLYQQRLARENAVDFNDLLLKALELAAHSQIGPELASRFRHVLVDEFQDTNRVQYRLVSHLSRGSGNLTAVGDDDQSIYSWRGAEPRNLIDFERDFPDATVIKLEQNYRSTQIILDAANGVIGKNRHRHDKALWTERGSGEPVLWEQCADERVEADFIARAMLGLVGEEGRDYGDLAVLYRTHAQSRVIEEQFRRYSISYRIVGGVSFFQRKEIKDVLAYLRLVIQPSADSCFERVINVPSRGIGKTTVERVRAHARSKNISLLDAARACSQGAMTQLRTAARKRLAGFVDIIDGLRDVLAADASVSELIIQAVERSGYRERLDAEGTPDAHDRLANLAELVGMASDFDDETEGTGTLVEFDERISLSSATDESDGRGTTSVTLMTIHAAKGLEFPVVFLCGMEDGLFPSLRERPGVDQTDMLEEERRLAYVAMTRAQDRLILTNAHQRRHWGQIRMSTPSRFLDEIPANSLAVRAEPERMIREPSERRRQRNRRAADRASSNYDEFSDAPAPPSYEEFDQRTYYDDIPEYTVDGVIRTPDGIDAGAAVNHSSFGEGTVIQAEGRGKNRKLLIDFSDYGLKTVLARFVERL